MRYGKARKGEGKKQSQTSCSSGNGGREEAVHKHIIAVALRGEEVDHETSCSCGIEGEEVVKDVEVSAGNILVIHIVRFYCNLKMCAAN